MDNEVVSYYSIRNCVFQVTSNDCVYSESIPPDLLGAKLLDYKPEKIHGKVYIVNFPNAKGAAASEDTLSLHGNFPHGDRAVSKQLSAGIVKINKEDALALKEIVDEELQRFKNNI